MSKKTTSTGAPRQPGDPLPKELVRELRQRNGLSQDELAQRLGLKGGKSVISGWENGHSRCEGPAAELLLRLFPEDTAAPEVASLLTEVEHLWKRAGNYVDVWRQAVAVPRGRAQIDRAEFARLFPGTEIPPREIVHGFPFVDLGVSHDVYGISPRGWTGIIPSEPDRPPAYLWTLGRDARFAYRERIWEDAPTAVTAGHTHLGSLFQLSLSVTYFLHRLFGKCRFDRELQYTLQLDLEGIRGRGLVGYRKDRTYPDLTLDDPPRTAVENHLKASIATTVGAIEDDPLLVGIELVGEIALLLRPDLAVDSILEDQLRRRHFELGRSGLPWLGFLDRKLGMATRKGLVSMSGRRVGVLEETIKGTRFTYDADYLKVPGARAISPTIPLDDKPYESLGLHPFFANLLPEGSRLDVASRQLKIDRNDRFGMLLAVGGEAIGAVEVRPDSGSGR
jgi:serine/threonine-protein kinase HipA